ncbi:unnamed protein product [Lampetra planeri]
MSRGNLATSVLLVHTQEPSTFLERQSWPSAEVRGGAGTVMDARNRHRKGGVGLSSSPRREPGVRQLSAATTTKAATTTATSPLTASAT